MAVQLEPVDMSSVIGSINMVVTEALAEDDLVRLSNVYVTKTSAAFLNCTSGSTGKPKIMEHTHGSLTYFLHSMNEAYQFRSTDNILQLASCQWTTHAWEITVSLCLGSTLVLLHPGGQLDIDYLIRTMTNKQISALTSLPSTARRLAEHVAIKSDETVSCFRYLRAYTIGGSIVTKHHIATLLRVIQHHWSLPRIMIALGTAETLGIVNHVINWDLLEINKDWDTLPLGKSLPGRHCFLRDIDSQQRITTYDVVGELCVVADDGVFKCYRGDPISTSQTKVILPEISTTSPVYVRTGDLCRYNTDGDIVYVGRKDFRVKIYGQLVEPEVIEQIVLKASDLVNCCIVRKEHVEELNDEYLSCHLVVTSAVDSQELIHQIQVYCRQYLPAFMVPVAWQTHSEFPLTPSGKIARKQLGEIKRTGNVVQIRDKLSKETNRNLKNNDEPSTNWEKWVHVIWCEILSITDPTTISVTAHLFSLGGNSFQFMNILAAYRNQFNFSMHCPTFIAFIQHATIREHARLLEQTSIDDIMTENKLTLQPLHITEGEFAFVRFFSESFRKKNCTRSRGYDKDAKLLWSSIIEPQTVTWGNPKVVPSLCISL